MLWYLQLQKQNKNQDDLTLKRLKIYSSRLLLHGSSKVPTCSCICSSDSVTASTGGVVSTEWLFQQNSYESTCLMSLYLRAQLPGSGAFFGKVGGTTPHQSTVKREEQKRNQVNQQPLTRLLRQKETASVDFCWF